MTKDDFQELGLVPGGRFVNRYEVVRKLGSGGMGQVFEVLDLSLNRERLAMKIFSPPEGENDTSLLSRFRNEVRITRKLSHPNIVRTYDFAELDNGVVYMTMEFVDGNSLDQILKENLNGRLDIDRAIRILSEIADGMAYAHQFNVIHRDLKPGNVLVSHLGQVKITDFGLAQSLVCKERLTMTGECVGTPAYMSPEQVLGQVADHRSDIYAMGMIAYELVTGDLPFRKKGWFELANQIVNEPVAPFADEFPDIPDWYEALVLKATDKNPENRFESTALLGQAVTTRTLIYADLHRQERELEDPFLNVSNRMTQVSSKQLAPLPSFSRVPKVQEIPTTKSLQLSVSIPTKPSAWFLTVAMIFVLSTIGIKSFQSRPENQKVIAPIIIQPERLRPRPLRPFLQQEIPMADSAVAQGNTGANQLPQSQIGSELANLLSDHLEEANTVGLADEQAAPSVPQKIREELKRRRQIQLQQKSNSNSPDPASFPRGYRSLK